MPAPVAITDSLESVLDIFFSGVRHRERAAFILCDNLVEMSCKTRAKQHDHNFDMRCSFHAPWNSPGVALDPNGLGQRVHSHRDTRNNMQHANAAATVDAGYCATAIADAVEVIQTLWSDEPLHPRVRCALRIVKLYLVNADFIKRDGFEDMMRDFKWRALAKESVGSNAVQIQPGKRDYWWWALHYRLPNIEGMLDKIGAP